MMAAKNTQERYREVDFVVMGILGRVWAIQDFIAPFAMREERR
jgi:hypothetical protein